MSFSNPWFLLALVATIGLYHVELISTLLNLSALRGGIPERLRGILDEKDFERTREYVCARSSLDVAEQSFMLAVTLPFWWAGGFGWLDRLVRNWHLPAIPEGLAIIGLVVLLQGLLSLPFDYWNTFVVERRFGFNRTTLKTFIMDRVKGLLLAVILGGPLLAFLLWMFGRYEYAALYGWVTVSLFSLLMTWLAPRVFLPLYYKFEPLTDETLLGKIRELSDKLRFPFTEVSVVDGSRRSTKANAFFIGFGRTKRIALFDTLLTGHSQDEILAVLAHEIGHCKRRHVPRMILLSLLGSAIMFTLLHFALHDPRLGAAFGVRHASIAWSLVFFIIVYQPLSTMMHLVSSRWSRRFEYEADAYARSALGNARPMKEALLRLSKDHLSHPTPHPFHVALHYSHPTVLQRVAALES
jgi:STE24 endopeptidase